MTSIFLSVFFCVLSFRLLRCLFDLFLHVGGLSLLLLKSAVANLLTILILINLLALLTWAFFFGQNWI